MKTFEEFQALATKVPLALRNNRDRINLPVTGLQEEIGKIETLLAAASASGRFALTPEHRSELQNRLADVLWYVALLCGETGMPMQEIAGRSVAQLQERIKQLDPDER